MKFFVRKKEYDAVKGALDACLMALDREHENHEAARRKNAELEKERAETQYQAEHFRARCEAYEDAARNAGFEFVGTPNGFALERLTDAQHPETFWERLKKWPQ